MHDTIAEGGAAETEGKFQTHELQFAGKRISLRWKGTGDGNAADGLSILEEVQARLELLEEAADRANRRTTSEELLLLGWLEAQREFDDYRRAVDSKRAELERRVRELEGAVSANAKKAY